jgi:hypothetical protein
MDKLKHTLHMHRRLPEDGQQVGPKHVGELTNKTRVLCNRDFKSSHGGLDKDSRLLRCYAMSKSCNIPEDWNFHFKLLVYLFSKLFVRQTRSSKQNLRHPFSFKYFGDYYNERMINYTTY